MSQSISNPGTATITAQNTHAVTLTTTGNEIVTYLQTGEYSGQVTINSQTITQTGSFMLPTAVLVQ